MARKAGITPEKRQQVLSAARTLIHAGTPRRGVDDILRRTYGVSVSHDAFNKLYREHVGVVNKAYEQRRLPPPRRPVRSESDRYNELIRTHFIHEEAQEFMKARSLKYHEFIRMRNSRDKLYKSFVAHTGLHYGDPEHDQRWRETVFDWYKRNNLMTFNAKLQRVPSPWDWFDRVSYNLPPEQRYTTKGRRKNTKKRTGVETAAMRAFRMRSINQLKDTLARQPFRAKELVPRIQKLGGRVSDAIKRKAGLG